LGFELLHNIEESVIDIWPLDELDLMVSLRFIAAGGRHGGRVWDDQGDELAGASCLLPADTRQRVMRRAKRQRDTYLYFVQVAERISHVERSIIRSTHAGRASAICSTSERGMSLFGLARDRCLGQDVLDFAIKAARPMWMVDYARD
jgi:hypothetical protein